MTLVIPREQRNQYIIDPGPVFFRAEIDKQRYSLLRNGPGLRFWRDGRVAEGAPLLREYTVYPVSRVRIPLSPPLT